MLGEGDLLLSRIAHPAGQQLKEWVLLQMEFLDVRSKVRALGSLDVTEAALPLAVVDRQLALSRPIMDVAGISVARHGLLPEGFGLVCH